MQFEFDLLKIKLLGLIWSIPFISSRWCWVDAVSWVIGETKIIGKADPACFYCGACHTDSKLGIFFNSEDDDQ